MPSIPTRMMVSVSNGLKEMAALLSVIQVSMIGHHDSKNKIARLILTLLSIRIRLYLKNPRPIFR
jgi:hypothetical protein